MRDLSRTVFQQRRGFSTSFLRIAVLVLVIGAAFFFLKNIIGGGFGGGSSGVTLRDAPLGLKPVSVGDTEIGTAGVNLTTGAVTLKDVKYDGEAKASATRSFGGGVYILSVEATLPDPKNAYYEVWLVGARGPVPVDFMRGSKNTWSLSLRDSDKYSSYEGIWITLERTKDELPEERVLEGSF